MPAVSTPENPKKDDPISLSLEKKEKIEEISPEKIEKKESFTNTIQEQIINVKPASHKKPKKVVREDEFFDNLIDKIIEKKFHYKENEQNPSKTIELNPVSEAKTQKIDDTNKKNENIIQKNSEIPDERKDIVINLINEKTKANSEIFKEPDHIFSDCEKKEPQDVSKLEPNDDKLFFENNKDFMKKNRIIERNRPISKKSSIHSNTNKKNENVVEFPSNCEIIGVKSENTKLEHKEKKSIEKKEKLATNDQKQANHNKNTFFEAPRNEELIISSENQVSIYKKVQNSIFGF